MKQPPTKRWIPLPIFLAALSVLSACEKENVSTPRPDEQELITTLSVRLSKQGSATRWFTYSVRNGFNTAGAAIRIDTIRLDPNSSYDASVFLYNEAITPPADVTGEIIEERNKHLFYYESSSPDSGSRIRISDLDTDTNGEPFGQRSHWETGSKGNGTMQILLIHGPRRKNATNPAAIAGATDADAIFPVLVE